VPVLLISSTSEYIWPSGRAPRVLVPLDGSALAEAALDPAGELAEALRAELILLQIVQPLPPRVATVAPGLAASHVTSELTRSGTYLTDISDRLERAGHRVVAHDAVGVPAATIAEVARAQRCDLIAMATRGRGGLDRLAHGSVATRVLQRTSIPLLLTRPAAAQQAASSASSPVEAAAADID
jgi:nucleotide-binding universal stress UspA family protein